MAYTLRNLLILLLLWTLPVIITGTQRHVMSTWWGQEEPLLRSILLEMPDWYFWAPLTPAVLQMSRRFPLESPGLGRAVAVHTALAILATLLWCAFLTAFIQTFDSWPKGPWTYEKVYTNLLLKHAHQHFLVYWGVVGAGVAMEFYGRYREREVRTHLLEAQLAEAQLRALKVQLHPHFLFNTLNSIAALVRAQEGKAAVKMIVGLSDLLRCALEGDMERTVPLRREVELLERYLEIQQVRFGERLVVEWKVQPEVSEWPVPTLLLQPLVENAVRHGVERRAAPTHIEVCAGVVQGRLKVTITDDGPGLPPGWDIERSTGVGLANCRERLRWLYGGGARLEVGPREGGGTRVELLLPAGLLDGGAGA